MSVVRINRLGIGIFASVFVGIDAKCLNFRVGFVNNQCKKELTCTTYTNFSHQFLQELTQLSLQFFTTDAKDTNITSFRIGF